MALIGVKNFYYAKQTKDDVSGLAFDTPVHIPLLNQLDVKFEADSADLYGDNGLAESYRGVKKATVDATVAEIPAEDMAELLGQTREASGMFLSESTTPPYVAVGYERSKLNGKRRRIWLYKGRFGVPDESNKTKGESTEIATEKITGDFGFTTYEDPTYGKVLRRYMDEDDPQVDATAFANFFNSVLPTADTTPPTVSCVPADAATGVAVGANIVLTFSEAINVASVIDGESVIVQKADGTQVAGVGAWNTGNTVYTFNPTVDLSASTDYVVLVTKAVKDLAGNKLAAVNVFNFTTAA